MRTGRVAEIALVAVTLGAATAPAARAGADPKRGTQIEQRLTLTDKIYTEKHGDLRDEQISKFAAARS